MTRLPLLVAAGWLGLHLLHDLTGVGGPSATAFEQQWSQPLTFLACGLAVLVRVRVVPAERLAWALVGIGLVFYGTGSVVYGLHDGPTTFPSPADALWLSLYPLSWGGIALLVRSRFARVGPLVWLDGLIVGAVVAGTAAALLLRSVFHAAVHGDLAYVASVAYPLGDLVPVALTVVLWSIAGRRLAPFWGFVGLGFAMLQRTTVSATGTRSPSG